jgi:hypothetical protein
MQQLEMKWRPHFDAWDGWGLHDNFIIFPELHPYLHVVTLLFPRHMTTCFRGVVLHGPLVHADNIAHPPCSGWQCHHASMSVPRTKSEHRKQGVSISGMA